MLVLILATLLIAFFPFSSAHFFSPSHPDILFMISHASTTHLAMNVLALLVVWLMAQKTEEKESRLVGVFVTSSVIPLFIPV
ncbi:MAG: hypothetical protein GOV01_03120, partial [Candidatus Altiarchaeota archaeon]|nr:hypothetical protein [Candidatus Altiarchaeota archaeon]